MYSVQTCTYTPQHIATFDHSFYDFHGTCQYQLVGLCRLKQGLDAIQLYVHTDGHISHFVSLSMQVDYL